MDKDISSLEKDVPFEKSEWPVLRIGWILMGVFLGAGVFGIFGSGIFSERVAEDGTLSVTYERYLRYSMHSEIQIKTSKLGADSSIWINADYLNKIMITRISPEPDSFDQVDGRMRIQFSSQNPSDITLHIEAVKTGDQNMTINVNGKKKTIHQYIYF
ncbi:hypothetical protein BDE36_2886 [Arcticibacter tournemirensis]|uniref:Uncharacterized protein n=1 Tax=Arcticibacter tournemirensis TaxID=699437 RepID=A0A5M9GYT9_9SPHI|nr:hypothetical protein [Arcticibacter tournemirensis]KAA8478537.1 hypothetical protein F1649_17685 [Arcticibacter tournemirensis]TQM51115.1 hypothetical protein BDE36_2886 [Arcticibacter tournemirensis]